MYHDPARKKTERFKLSLSSEELELLDLAAEIYGGQRAVIAREILMDWARSVVAAARSLPGRASFGVVSDDGQIKYRFA